jgi:CCR4-NOT complex subunit CAF16
LYVLVGYGCPLQADIPVHGMMKVLQAEYPERRDELIELLGIEMEHLLHSNLIILFRGGSKLAHAPGV